MTEFERAYNTGEDEMAARNALVLRELPQVRSIAARIRERLPRHVEMEDLVSAGVVGLMEACAKYDAARNAGFATFAKFRIRGAILDSLRSLDWGSRTVRRRSRAITAATNRLTGTLGRLPLQEEVAADLGVTLSDLHATLAELAGLCVAGQQAERAEEDAEGYDLIESAEGRQDESPFDLCLKAEMRGQLVEALERLPARERTMLALYYQEELTMREVAEVLGVGTSRVSQLLSATLAELRASMRQRSGPDGAPHARHRRRSAEERTHP